MIRTKRRYVMPHVGRVTTWKFHLWCIFRPNMNATTTFLCW